MKFVRNWMCLLAVLALAGGIVACGTQKEEIETPDNSVVSSEDEGEKIEDILKETDAPNEDAPIDMDDLVVKGGETTPAGEQTTEAGEEGVTEASDSAETTPAAQDPDSQPGEQTSADSSPSSDSTADSKPDNTAETQGAQQNSQAAETSAPVQETVPPATEAPTEPVDPENVVAGIIDLNSMTCEGETVSINGNVVSITGEGTYILSGNLPEGMVEINTKLKVKLKLNGVNIINSTGPAILCNDAKRLTVTLIEGTVNHLTGGSVANDGAIFTNDTLEVKGAGTLYVNGTVEHGISSDDDIIVKNGEIHVNAVKTGMMANDDITIAGGSLNVVGGTNGVKSKGTLHVTGGTLWTMGGPKETKSALYAMTTFTITGGNVYAVGCGASIPDGATSTQPSIMVTLSPSLAANGTASITSGGTSIMDTASPFAFNTIFVSTPAVRDGMEFNVFANGADCGVFTTSGMATSVMAATQQ